jgi:hypothetical protein
MLLDGPIKDIDFRYFLFHRTSFMNAPHLFVDGSPLLLFAAMFQEPATIESLLDIYGVTLMSDIKTLAAQLLLDIELSHGGTGYTTTLEDLRQTMKSRLDSLTNVKYYKGYNDAASYRAVSVKSWEQLRIVGKYAGRPLG